MKHIFNIRDEAEKSSADEIVPAFAKMPVSVATELALNITFSENIRLVIWDLDETFWKGTLTEGQITWVDEYADIVKSLAARGIISSICSKNDFEPTMQVIKAWQLDSYFIFPSIDWSN